jgi:hypothetical protein
MIVCVCVGGGNLALLPTRNRPLLPCPVLCPTGLFFKATPQCRNATYSEAPAFIARPADAAAAEAGDVLEVQTVPPLGVIRFAVTPRGLPPIKDMTFRLDSSLKVIYAACLFVCLFVCPALTAELQPLPCQLAPSLHLPSPPSRFLNLALPPSPTAPLIPPPTAC